jgi:hypothetical protein
MGAAYPSHSATLHLSSYVGFVPAISSAFGEHGPPVVWTVHLKICIRLPPPQDLVHVVQS